MVLKVSKILLLAVTLFGFPEGVAAQPSPGGQRNRGSISAIHPTVRAEIDRLASDEAGRRATGAEALAQMGATAAPAIPWLIAAVSDDRQVLSFSTGNTTVGELATRALGQIGSSAITQLLALVQNSDADDSLRNGSVIALGRFRESTAVGPLIVALLKLVEGGKDVATRSLLYNLSKSLSCFPEPRVAEALLDAVEKLQAAGADRLPPLAPFSDLTGYRSNFGQPVSTAATSARQWWASNKATVTLRPASNCYSIPVVR